MHIIRLEAENIKRLKAVDITPKSMLVEIAGNNGNGKTSVLDSILWALQGGRTIQDKPIRKGADKGVIRIDLGEGKDIKLRVTRTFRPSADGEGAASTLSVEDESGKIRSPQDLLNAIVGKIAFDPREFLTTDSKGRVAIVKSLVPGIDFDALARAREKAYDNRTDINRDAKRTRNAIAEDVARDGDLAEIPDKEIDTADLDGKIAENTALRKAHGDLVAARARQQGEIDLQLQQADADQQRADDLRAQADRLQAQATQRREAAQAALAALDKVPKPEDPPAIDDLLAQKEQAISRNALVAVKKRRQLQITEAERLEAASAGLTDVIEKIDAQVRDAVENAKLPVRGLTFDENDVMLAGVPFDQASDAEQLRASVAIAIAMNPKLRVMRIRDGSLLDDDAMAILAKVADAEDFQIWIERVAPSGPSAIILEDGRVKDHGDA